MGSAMLATVILTGMFGTLGDISRKVREMELHSAARLVEGHFGPAWRKTFLGLPGLTPFVAPTEFFRPFLNESALFNHTWQLVGRSDHIRQSHEFIKSQQQNVAILVGRGGIGKSKILHALAESFDTEHEGMSLWFMAEGVPLTQDGADHLPYKPCVVVVDDAHRRSDLPILLVFHQFASLCPTEVLRNLSELDWRLRQSGGQAPDLLDDVLAGHRRRIP